MGKNPSKTELRMDRILNAWETLAPRKTFAGLTLAQIQAKAEPPRATRRRIADLEDQLTEALTARDKADNEMQSLLDSVVNAVRGDLSEGPDSALYQAMGYRRKSEYKSGLTRRRPTSTPAQAEAGP